MDCALSSAERLLDSRGSPGLGALAVFGTLARFGDDALRYAHSRGIRIVLLAPRESYAHASIALTRMGVDVDAWPAPPAGLFVVEERCVYLRSRSPMTVAHLFGHALDCALGGGVYRSGIDPRVRALFSAARAFITPYAATGLDEYFAESLRAYVEANDSASVWSPATRERLQRIDAPMYVYVDELFANAFERLAPV
ncbi:MAG TPA: hypothetical protein VIJ12_10520 [Candidatus Baltobacteraceae bacterium]